MSFIVRVDPSKRLHTAQVPLDDAFKAQRAIDEAEDAARRAQPKPPTPEQRLATLETEIAALKAARAGK